MAVAKEYHLIMVLARALEGHGMPGANSECGNLHSMLTQGLKDDAESFLPEGLEITTPDRDRFLGGHIEDMVPRSAAHGMAKVAVGTGNAQPMHGLRS